MLREIQRRRTALAEMLGRLIQRWRHDQRT